MRRSKEQHIALQKVRELKIELTKMDILRNKHVDGVIPYSEWVIALERIKELRRLINELEKEVQQNDDKAV